MPLDPRFFIRSNEHEMQQVRDSLMTKIQGAMVLNGTPLGRAEEHELAVQLRSCTLEELRQAESQLFPPLARTASQPDFRDDTVPWTTSDNGGGLSANGIKNGSDRIPLTDDNFNASITQLRAHNEVLKNRLVDLERRINGLEAVMKAQHSGKITGV